MYKSRTVTHGEWMKTKKSSLTSMMNISGRLDCALLKSFIGPKKSSVTPFKLSMQKNFDDFLMLCSAKNIFV